MQRLFAAVIALACVVASTPSFARAGFAHGPGFAHRSGRGGFVRNPTILFGAPAPQMPAFENRIPAPLSPPAEAPIINGPLSQPAFRGMTGIGQ
jgi:hypothetical protein